MAPLIDSSRDSKILPMRITLIASSPLALALACLVVGASAASAAPRVVHEADRKLVTMTDGGGGLVLRLNYDGRCMLDRVLVRGRNLVQPATGVCSSIRTSSGEYTTRSGLAQPEVTVAGESVTVSGIRFGGGGTEAEETWAFSVGDPGSRNLLVRGDNRRIADWPVVLPGRVQGIP
jgi:hypothetical protein